MIHRLHALAGLAAVLVSAPAPAAAVADIPVRVTTYAAGGTLAAQPSHASVSNYGIKPSILLNPNEDGSYDVALHLAGASRIQILRFDKAGTLAGRLSPDVLAGAKGLLGLARLEDGGFAVGWAKDSPHSGAAYEFHVTRVDAGGAMVFSTLVFGDKDKTLVDAKGEPGTFSSGRLAYNRATGKLCAYVGHTMKWSDGVRHQGGHVSFLDMQGVNLVANGWYFSHNFDQRLMVAGGSYYTLAHGDAYPRALGFAKWSDGGAAAHTKGRQEFSKDFLRIPGAVGDNQTSTQLGGMVAFPDGTFGVVFTTAHGRANLDVGYRRLSAAGDTSGLTWLTSHPASTIALFPRIARFGENVLVLWEQVAGGSNAGVQAAIVSPSGSMVAAAAPLADRALRLPPHYDLVNLPDGTVLWAGQKGNDSVSVFRIPPPSGPAGRKAPARASAMPGPFRIREYDPSGRILSVRTGGLPAGRFPIPASSGPSLFEVGRRGGTRSLLVVP